MTSAELTAFCPGGTITNVDCMTVDNIEYFSSGEVLTCTANGGLQCSNADNFPVPCSDYKIRYECTCGKFSTINFTSCTLRQSLNQIRMWLSR
jgi:hypothetical protein